MHNSKSIAMDSQNSIEIQKGFNDTKLSFGTDIQEDWLEYIKPFESFTDQKKALAMSFLSQIYSQADLCPMNLKIVLKYFYEEQFQYYEGMYLFKHKYEIKQLACLKVWQII